MDSLTSNHLYIHALLKTRMELFLLNFVQHTFPSLWFYTHADCVRHPLSFTVVLLYPCRLCTAPPFLHCGLIIPMQTVYSTFFPSLWSYYTHADCVQHPLSFTTVLYPCRLCTAPPFLYCGLIILMQTAQSNSAIVKHPPNIFF